MQRPRQPAAYFRQHPIRSGRILVGVTLVLLMSSCAGPTVTADQYQSKVVQTAKAMTGIIVTAQRAARLDVDGKTLHTVTDTVVSNAEEDARSVQTTIESRQPPNRESDRLFQRVDVPLRDTTRLMILLRIAVRRNDHPTQLSLAQALSAPLAVFHQLSESVG